VKNPLRDPRPWQATLDGLPKQPGVYLLKDRHGKIVYVGKAGILADRVRSYFQKGADLTPKNRILVSLVKGIETMATHSELEALILESTLIKQHRPRFNVLLRDDKHYPYLRLPIRDPFPRLSIVRRVKRDQALYFGPYVPAGALRETLKVIRKVFPLATCRINIDGRADRACLEFEIKRCMAPCTGNQTQHDYQQIVKQVRLFLEGRDKELLQRFKSDMQAASDREDFEEAARFRDRIMNIERTLEKQRVAQIGPVDQDVLGLARSGSAADIQMLFVRGGLMIGRKDFFWSECGDVLDQELIRSTVEQFYQKAVLPPKELLVSRLFHDWTLVQTWLSDKKGETVRILSPKRGIKHHLLQLAEENATVSLVNHVRANATGQQALAELKTLFGLPCFPHRIEGFDISNTMGTYSVASLVVWEDGQLKKDDYRRFRIQTVEGANDFASIEEVVVRRFGGSLSTGETKALPIPDLVLIDGGPGQLRAAMDALKKIGLSKVQIFGLAKARGAKEERVFLPGHKEAMVLDLRSVGARVLQLVRDEAHRFAIRYHRTLRAQGLLIPQKQARTSSTIRRKRLSSPHLL